MASVIRTLSGRVARYVVVAAMVFSLAWNLALSFDRVLP